MCFFGHFLQPPCWTKGEKINAEGLGFGGQCWHSGSRGTDPTSEA